MEKIENAESTLAVIIDESLERHGSMLNLTKAVRAMNAAEGSTYKKTWLR